MSAVRVYRFFALFWVCFLGRLTIGLLRGRMVVVLQPTLKARRCASRFLAPQGARFHAVKYSVLGFWLSQRRGADSANHVQDTPLPPVGSHFGDSLFTGKRIVFFVVSVSCFCLPSRQESGHEIHRKKSPASTTGNRA